MGLLYIYFCPLVQALGATIQYGSPLCIFLPTCTDSGYHYSVWVSFMYIFVHLYRLWVLIFSMGLIFAHLCRLWVPLFSMGLLYVYFCPLVQALGTTIQYGSPLCLFLPTCAGSGYHYSVWVSFMYIFAHLCRLWVPLFSMGLLYVYFCPLVQTLGTTIQYGSPLCIFLSTCTGSGC